MNHQNPIQHTITLDPLREQGPDALDTHDVPGLDTATLTDLELKARDEATGTIIRHAKNIFAPTAASPIPAATTMVQAGIELRIAGADRPHKVTLRPPAAVLLEFPTDAPLVFQWLDNRHLRLAAALIIAFATALAPQLDDDDVDEDDISSDHPSFAV